DDELVELVSGVRIVVRDRCRVHLKEDALVLLAEVPYRGSDQVCRDRTRVERTCPSGLELCQFSYRARHGSAAGRAVGHASHRAKTLRVYWIREATETVDSPARARVPQPGLLNPTLARFGPTTRRAQGGSPMRRSIRPKPPP